MGRSVGRKPSPADPMLVPGERIVTSAILRKDDLEDEEDEDDEDAEYLEDYDELEEDEEEGE